jgi:hypothetical protein
MLLSNVYPESLVMNQSFRFTTLLCPLINNSLMSNCILQKRRVLNIYLLLWNTNNIDTNHLKSSILLHVLNILRCFPLVNIYQII